MSRRRPRRGYDAGTDRGGRVRRGASPGGTGFQGGPGSRRQRLASDRHERRRRLAKFILAGGLVTAAAFFLAVSFIIRAGDSGAGQTPGELLEGDSGSGNVILMARDEAGTLSHLGVLTAGPEGGYSLYLIPARTVAATTDQGFQQLDVLLEASGQEALDQAVADLLQLPVQYHVTTSYAALELLAQQAGAINFATPKPLTMNADPGGSGPETVLAAGSNPNGLSTSMALVKQAAADNRDGPKVMAAFYQGLRDALVPKPEVDRRSIARQYLERIETDMDEDRFIDLFADATSPERLFGVWPLPVRTAGAGAGWYFEPVADELDVLLTGSPADSAYILEIRNGTEAQGVVEAVSVKLEPLRYRTTLSPEPSGVNFDHTQIRCGTDAILAGNRVQASLGTGTMIKDEYLEKNQIIVIIGRDIAAAMSGPAAAEAPGP